MRNDKDAFLFFVKFPFFVTCQFGQHFACPELELVIRTAALAQAPWWSRSASSGGRSCQVLTSPMGSFSAAVAWGLPLPWSNESNLGFYTHMAAMAHIVILGMSGMTIAVHAPIFPTMMFWLLTMAPLTMRKSPCRQSVASTKWKQECRLHVVIAEAPSRWPSPVIWVEREQLIKKTSNSSNCVQDILIHCKMLVPFCYWMLLNDSLPYVQKVDLLDFGMFQGTAQNQVKLAISM